MSAQTATSATSASIATQIIIPNAAVLIQAAKIAIQYDRPIQLDYYVDTAQAKAFLVEDSENKDNRVLLKSRDEYTSLITKVLKEGDDYIVLTENSIYITNSKMSKKRFPLSSLAQD